MSGAKTKSNNKKDQGLSRRYVIKGSLATGAFLACPSLLQSVAAQEKSSGRKALPIPKLDAGTLKNGVRVFNLNLQEGLSQFLPGKATPTLGVNGSYLGPTLKFTDGEKIKLNVTNGIGEATTLHWHGLHLPAKADGGPHQVIAPGQTWSPSFQVKQQAATFWYHPHFMHKTGLHAYYGMAGMIHIEDTHSKQLDIPKTYGVDDIPVVLQDKRFNQDGSLQFVSAMHDKMAGMKGNVLLTNGAIFPIFNATTQKVRLRVLNASNARTYQLGFSDGRPFFVIAGDGSFLPKPARLNRVVIAPGERAQIVVDLSNGKRATLQSFPYQTTGGGGMMGMMMSRMADENRIFQVLDLMPSSAAKPSPAVPATLATLPKLDPKTATKTRKFELQMLMGPQVMMSGRTSFTINGKEMDLKRIDQRVKLGATEIWEISNPSAMGHPFHIHDIQFKILDRNGAPPRPFETGLKDTVMVHPGDTVRVIAKFEDYADPDTPYMYHCHILEHEDGGMMGQFVVEA